MFIYYKDLFGKLYLKKGEGPLKKLSTSGCENSISLRPPGGYKISQEIFFTEISDEEFFNSCRGWGRKTGEV